MSPPLGRIVAMLHVADVARSVAFYEQLGFTVENKIESKGKLSWAWLQHGKAELMVTQAEEPVNARAQAVIFYIYTDDVVALHAELTTAGLPVRPIERPFYSPRGEFRLKDVDGYDLIFAHAD